MQQEIEDLMCFVDEFAVRYQAEYDSLPYHFNIVDELRVNENAHTRILMKLLQYEKGKKFPILVSFIKSLSVFINEDLQIKRPNLYTGLEFIDGLIEDPGNYAFIVENKVCGAVDQYYQLERYIDSVERHGFKNKDIYVIYLTLDGNKTVCDYSLTTKAKKKLGYENDQTSGRFLQINYSQHILPWLKAEIALTYKDEEYLYSGIYQYIDYIEGLLDIRKDDKPMKERLNELIEAKYELNSKDSIENLITVTEKLSSMELLKDSLIDMQDSYIKDICDQSLLPKINKFTKKYGYLLEEFSCNNYSIVIILVHPDWKKCKLKFYTEGQNNVLGICYVDSTKPISEKAKKSLMIDSYKTATWWPVWKYPPNTFRYINTEFWLSVARGDLSLFLVDEFEKISNIIKVNELKV